MTQLKKFPRKTSLRLGLRKLKRDERGLSTVEYVILLALIAVATIGIWREFGSAVHEKVKHGQTEVQKL